MEASSPKRSMLRENGATKRTKLQYSIPFGSVFISPLPQNVTKTQLTSYCKRFGEIYDVNIIKRDLFSIGEVEFSHAESVINMLSVLNHRFDGDHDDINVWTEIKEYADYALAENIRQKHRYKTIIASIAEPPADETPILSLNDDCLIEIFGHLPILDLISISDTCMRFRTTAPLAFNSARKIIDFGLLNTESKYDNFKNVLSHFGHLIVDLTVQVNALNFRRFSKKSLIALAKYCTGSLKSLNLQLFKIVDESIITLIQSLFNTLESIVLRNGSLYSGAISECSQLTHLEIIDVENFDGKAFDHCYPLLKSFTFISGHVGNVMPTKRFFQNHKNLETIVIERQLHSAHGFQNGFRGKIMLYSLIPHVSENLHSLQLDGFHILNDMLPELQPIFNQLKYLKLRRFRPKKALAISLFSDSVENQLEEIDIWPLRQTNTLTDPTVFPNLERLQLNFSKEEVNDEILKEFLRKQMKLKEITLYNIHKIGSTDILTFISKKLKLVKKLNLRFVSLESSQQLTNFACVTKTKIRFRMMANESLGYQLKVYGLDEDLVDFIDKFPKLHQLDLFGSISYDVPGGPFVVLKGLLTKLSYIAAINITVDKLLLDDKSNDCLNRIAHANNQKLNIIFNRGAVEKGFMLDMALDTRRIN